MPERKDPWPKDRDAEEQVIGSLMLAPKMIPAIAEILKPEDFSSSTNETTYRAILELAAGGRAIDPVALASSLNGNGHAVSKLPEIMLNVTMPSNAMHHARTVHDQAQLRRLALLGEELVARVSQPGVVLSDVLTRGEESLYQIASSGYQERVMWSTAVTSAIERIEYQQSTGSQITGIPTGIHAVDYALGGLQPRWLAYVAARPGVGKTAFVLQAAIHAAREGHRVMFVSLEMSGLELASRAACTVAGVSYSKVRHRQLKDEDWRKFLRAEEQLSQLPIDIFDTDVDSVARVMTHARWLRPDLLIVDYVQLMRETGARTRTEEVTTSSNGLKRIARTLGIPVVACAQLNREPEKREEKRPTLSDLRDSGALEQDADVVYLLHRTGGNRVDFIRSKFRHGPGGVDAVGWNADITAFYDIT